VKITPGWDFLSGYSVSTAIMQGRRFEALGIAHFEEPIPYYDLPGLRQFLEKEGHLIRWHAEFNA
jgi:L-alanine-DL-glutamate epimerase-like enolase superfamily enzyme